MVAEPSRLELKLVGPVDIQVDGRPLAVDTKKAVALLAYLAVSGQEQSRDHLADLLWPETDPERARATLRRTLSALRSGLGERWVEADRSSVRFKPDDDTFVDVDQLLHAAAETHDHGLDRVCPRCIDVLSPAAAMLRGEFMEGFALRGCPAFDDWMRAEAEHLRRRVSLVLERLSTAFASQGRYPEAIQATGRWLAVDPLLEKAHRSMMLLHAWSGDRSGAVDSYRACVAVLDRELGVEPLEETTELYEAILEEDLPRAPAPVRRLTAVEAPAPAPVGYPFVGRSEHLERLRGVITAGHGLAIVEGEVGAGKTRLIDELVGELRSAGRVVLVAEAHRTEATVAYGPIQSLLRAGLEEPGTRDRLLGVSPSVAREVARLVPELGEPAAVDPADIAARARFLDAVSVAIGAMGEPAVLCVDNLHWLDSASLELVGYLARRLQRLGVVLVLSRRPEDTPIDHPVSVLIEDLAAAATVVRLDRLEPDAVAELVAASGVAGVDPAGVFERTKGLPFFVVEYLDAARLGRTELPAAVRRLVLSRLTGIGALGGQLITTAAVIGPTAEAEMIRSVSGRDEDEVVGGLDDLMRRSLLKEREDGSLEFVHDQLREVAYEEASHARRRLLHRRAAEHLMSRSGAESDLRAVSAASGHHLAAGNDAEAARLSVVAARLASEVFAFEEAIDHYENALALGTPDRGAVLRETGALHMLRGEYGVALANYETARALMTGLEVRRDSAMVAHAIGEVYRRLRRWDLAAASFEEAHTELGGDPTLGPAVAADWAFVEHNRGHEARAQELVRHALEGAAASSDPAVMAHVHNLAGLLCGETGQKIAHLEEALSHAVEPSVRAAILNNQALALASSGDLSGAIVNGRRALEAAMTAGDRHRTAALHDNLADSLHRAGEEEAAMEELKRAVTLFAEVGLEPGELVPEVWFLKEW
ncbi:MAG TPA: BTAD domain-containing putative transcriptional regulator [Acidimicrobiia bacterium]